MLTSSRRRSCGAGPFLSSSLGIARSFLGIARSFLGIAQLSRLVRGSRPGRWLFGILGGFLLLFGCCRCTAINYEDEEGPRYSGSFTSGDFRLEEDELRVVAFNIEFSKHIDRAIDLLATNPNLRGAHVLLLQEMHGAGVEKISQELGYDYVYYPGSKHQGGDFGNAVLSRFPIVDDRKIILPHRNPTSGRVRIAVSAVLDTPHGLIGAISVHNDTPWLGPAGRLDQAEAVRQAAFDLGIPVVLGGDFNTSDQGSAEATVAVFTGEGFSWASRGVRKTGGYLGRKMFDLDHVFSLDLAPLGAGTVKTDASDHQPVWVRLAFPNLPDRS